MFFPKQNQCLEARATSGDEIVFQTLIQGSRRYTSLPTKDHYARFLLSGQHGADYCNELLFSDCHSFLDLDCPSTLEQLGWESEAAFIQAFNALLITCFEKHLTVSLKPNDILWSCSTRPGKTSYHIKINCEHYWTPEQRKGDMKGEFRLHQYLRVSLSGARCRPSASQFHRGPERVLGEPLYSKYELYEAGLQRAICTC